MTGGRRILGEVSIRPLDRRQFLLRSGALLAFGAKAAPLRGAEPAVRVVAGARILEVDGRAARVLGLSDARADAWSFRAGAGFRLRLENALAAPTLIHWHGLTPPFDQDGTPEISQPLLAPGAGHDYDFALDRPGTYWMHSQHGLQSQHLLAAPLIVRDPAEAGRDEQDVVLMLHDFTFRDPEEILAELRLGGAQTAQAKPPAPTPDDGGMTRLPDAKEHGAAMNFAPAPAPAPDPGCCTLDAAGGTHVNDVTFDAYLANDRTLADPQVVRVEPRARLRLRVINGAAATAFHLDTGALDARLIAVDGHEIVPVVARRFPLAGGQRLDLRLELPASGAFPILALREGARERTGILLATPGAAIRRVAGIAAESAPEIDLALDARLRAVVPLAARPADRHHVLRLTGDHSYYRWRLEPAAGARGALAVRRGERVEVTFSNATNMAHPMHLHGHVFQLVAIDGRRFAGPLRDTVLVPAAAAVTIAFDADNPGPWALHCQHLYHRAAGMMAVLRYET